MPAINMVDGSGGERRSLKHAVAVRPEQELEVAEARTADVRLEGKREFEPRQSERLV